MATPASVAYTVTGGTAAFGGRFKESFDSVEVFSEDSGIPYNNPNQILTVVLHGSGGANYTVGRQYRAVCSGAMAYAEHNVLSFGTVRVTTGHMRIRPVDNYGLLPSSARRESMWLGFRGMPDTKFRLLTQRRVDAMVDYALTSIPNIDKTRVYLTGGSMGGWGSMTYGIRRVHIFPAIYPDRPKWRYSQTGKHMVADYGSNLIHETVGSPTSPDLAPEDGGGKLFELQDCITYAANTANRIPWIGWCGGRQDGYFPFEDYVTAVAALRKAKRGFAFAWNNGNHTEGSIIDVITASYPYGLFQLDKGYPLFTEHSGDQDPAVDIEGGINIGLTFRNVVETASSWSCEVTHITSACTVKVEPISRVFLAKVAAQAVTVPSANTWVPVSFNI